MAIDYGVKKNILRNFSNLGCKITVVPADSSFELIEKLNPDGIFLSNGPGDPAATSIFAKNCIQKILEKQIPIFGICLGHQLLGHALGCTTKKMHQGHRGANHPVKNLLTEKVEITSQNHGFEIDQSTLPKDIDITHVLYLMEVLKGFLAMINLLSLCNIIQKQVQDLMIVITYSNNL